MSKIIFIYLLISEMNLKNIEILGVFCFVGKNFKWIKKKSMTDVEV